MTAFLEFLSRALIESGALFTEMAPYLLLGFAANAMVALLVPERWITRLLGRPGFSGVLWATLIGIPLPLCSCSVLPMAMGLRARGASVGATIAFLIATPQTGVDSILVTGQMLGWPFAFFKVGAALITGLLAGAVAEWLLPRAATDPATAAPPPAPVPVLPGWPQRIRHAFLVGFLDFPASLGGVLVVGILIGGLLTALIPPNYLASADPGNRFLSMAAMLLMAVPMYVCSTGSVPVAVSFHEAGVAQGALLIFLMAGPATNIAEITVINKRLGGGALAVFLGVIVVASIGLGFGFDRFSGMLELDRPLPADLMAEHAAHAGHSGHGAQTAAANAPTSAPALALAPLDWIWIGALSALLLFPPLRKISRGWFRPAQEDSVMATADNLKTYEFELQGLNCDHCIRSAKTSLEGLPGLESLTVNLHKAVLKGKDLNVNEVVARIKKQGFEAHLAPPA